MPKPAQLSQPAQSAEQAPAPAGPAEEEAPPLLPPPLPAQRLRRGSGLRLPAGRRLEGLALLLLTAMLWGTYAPTLRLAYRLPDPPAPSVVAAARGTLQLLLLLAVILLGAAFSGRALPHTSSSSRNSSAVDAGAQDLLLPCQRQQSAGEEDQQQQEQAVVVVEEEQRPPRLPLGLPAALLASIEIGLYNTTGTLAQTAGLALTTAARGAFLIQASTVFTPLLAAALGMAPSRRAALERPQVLGSLLALAGTLLIALDRTGLLRGLVLAAQLTPARASGSAAATVAAAAAVAGGAAGASAGGATAAARATAAPSPLGDGLIVFAALCYSASTVRIPAWAVHRGVGPLQLALGKSAFLAAVSAAALAADAVRATAAGQRVACLWLGWRQPRGWALLLWSALGPGALSAFLHVKGQTLVSPTDAQVLFTSVPLWSALLAAVALPGEPLSRGTLLGGALVLAAGLVAALPQAAARVARGGGSPSADE